DVHRADPLQSAPGGHAVDLEHHRRAIIAAQQIDAAEIGTDCRGSADRQLFQLTIAGQRLRRAALLDIGDPAVAAPGHARDRGASDHQYAKIVIAAIPLDAHEALE